MSSHVNASTDGVWQWLRSHTNLVDISRAYYEETFGAVSQEHIYGDNVAASVIKTVVCLFVRTC